MFNREKVAELQVTILGLQALVDSKNDLIRRAAVKFAPPENIWSASNYSSALTTYLDQLDREHEQQIQDDILREKVEKIVLTLKAHKWEPA